MKVVTWMQSTFQYLVDGVSRLFQPTDDKKEKPIEHSAEPKSLKATSDGKQDMVDQFWKLAESIHIPDDGRTVSMGVGLKPSEIAMLNDIANETGVPRNAFARLAVRRFIQMYRAGLIQVEIEEPTPNTAAIRKKLVM